MAQGATGFSRKQAAATAVAEAPVPLANREPAALRTVVLDAVPLLAPYKRHGRLTLRVERMPQLARLSAGRNNGDGTWSLAFDELDGLTYQFPENLKAHTLALRIMAFDGSDVATLKLLDYPVTPEAVPPPLLGEKSLRPAGSAEPDDGATANLQACLAVREAEIVALRQDAQNARSELAQLQAELTVERHAWRRESQDALSQAQARWQAEEATRLEVTETAWRGQAEQALAEAAAACARLELELTHARDEARGQARSEDELNRLHTALVDAEAARERREEEFVRRQSDFEQARQCWREETEAALSQARNSWTAAEAARLAAAEAQWREQSARALADVTGRCAQLERQAAARMPIETAAAESRTERESLCAALTAAEAALQQREQDLARQRTAAGEALAQMTARCESAQQALAEAREQALQAQAHGDDAYIESLRSELAALQKALVGREAELARAHAALEQARVQQHRPLPELAADRPVWVPLQPEEAPQPRGSSRVARDVALVMLLVVPAILFYPRLVSLLPENLQYDLYTMAGGLDVARDAVSPSSVPAKPPAAAAPQTATVTHAVNVRAAPSAAAAIVSTAPRNTQVAVLARRGNWRLVGLSAGSRPLQGWVYGTYLKQGDEQSGGR
jgi:hypothetical protein